MLASGSPRPRYASERGAEPIRDCRLERRECVEEPRGCLQSLRIELAVNLDLEAVGRGDQCGAGGERCFEVDEDLERGEEAGIPAQQPLHSVLGDVGLREAVIREPVCDLLGELRVGKRAGLTLGVDDSLHRDLGADDQEAAGDRGCDPAISHVHLDAIALARRYVASGERPRELLRALVVGHLEQVDLLGRAALAGDERKRQLAAEPRLHVLGEVDSTASGKRNHRHQLARQQRQPCGQLRRRLGLFRVRVEVRVQIGERIGRDQLGRIVGRRTAVPGRELAGEVGNRGEPDQSAEEHETDRRRDQPAGASREPAPGTSDSVEQPAKAIANGAQQFAAPLTGAAERHSQPAEARGNAIGNQGIPDAAGSRAARDRRVLRVGEAWDARHPCHRGLIPALPAFAVASGNVGRSR